MPSKKSGSSRSHRTQSETEELRQEILKAEQEAELAQAEVDQAAAQAEAAAAQAEAAACKKLALEKAQRLERLQAELEARSFHGGGSLRTRSRASSRSSDVSVEQTRRSAPAAMRPWVRTVNVHLANGTLNPQPMEAYQGAGGADISPVERTSDLREPKTRPGTPG